MKRQDFFHPIIEFKNNNQCMLIALILFTLIIHWPQHDFWPLIVQGDMGRELYVFHRTQLGDLPYRDYFYNYGPLMPFYYALFNIIFGVKFTSVLYGVMFLDVAAGLLIYFILIRWTTPVIAFLGASWFWLFYEKIIFNFNHIGAVPLILLNVFLLIRFYDFPKVSTFMGMAFTILLLFLQKINLGAAALASTMLTIFVLSVRGGLRGFPIKWPLLWLLFLPISMAALIYYFLLQGLPIYYIKQCLPFTSGYLQSHPYVVFLPRLMELCYTHFMGLIHNELPTSLYSSMWPDRIIFVSMINFIILYIVDRRISRPTFILFICLLLFCHEYFIMGIHYELWAPYPIFICLFFLMAGISLQERPITKKIWILIIGVAILVSLFGTYSLKDRLIRSKNHFVSLEKIQVYAWNPPSWVNVVKDTSNYLKTHLLPDERFFAIPYEPLYYWLLDRKSPVVETTFFDCMNIPAEEQKRIMTDLDKERVNYIIMSNRVHSPEKGLGKFGTTNNILLAEYIESHFVPVITFGEWDNEALWPWDHAIRIFKRKK